MERAPSVAALPLQRVSEVELHVYSFNLFIPHMLTCLLNSLLVFSVFRLLHIIYFIPFNLIGICILTLYPAAVKFIYVRLREPSRFGQLFVTISV